MIVTQFIEKEGKLKSIFLWQCDSWTMSWEPTQFRTNWNITGENTQWHPGRSADSQKLHASEKCPWRGLAVPEGKYQSKRCTLLMEEFLPKGKQWF